MKLSLHKWTERGIVFLLSTSIVCFVVQNGMIQRSYTGYLIIHQTQNTFAVRSRKYLLSVNEVKPTQSNYPSLLEMSENNRTTTRAPSDNWRQYQKEALAVFILSAIGSNVTSKRGYRREIKLNGWEAIKHSNMETKCCVLWKSDKYSKYKNPVKIYWKKSRLRATQFTCPIKGPLIDVKGVTLEFNGKLCPTGEGVYMKPVLPKVQMKQSFAICVKIVYGIVDMDLLVDWLEFYREMKVDKVFMFTYNLTDNIEKILYHYINIGFLDRRQFDFPWKKDGHLKREVGVKTPSVWQDEQVVVFDCYQRLHGYTYISIVDIDEFLLPRKQGNIKEMMIHLTNDFPNAAGFTFKSYIFAKDWNKTVYNTGSDVVQYLRRTPALYTRQKNILISGRVLPESIDTHEFEPIEGYERITVPETTGAINHYRTCYSNFRKLCNNKNKQIFDNEILKVVQRFHNRTLWVHDVGI